MAQKLLLVDDSVTIQRVVELTFADENVQVIAAGTRREAVEKIERERPDIVLADVGGPEPDGFAVAAFVKGHPVLGATPVFLLTGALEPIDEERVRGLGCAGVLAKPFDPQAIIARVRDVLTALRDGAAADAVAATTGPIEEARTASGVPAPSAADRERDPLDEYFDRLDAAFAEYEASRGGQQDAAGGSADAVRVEVPPETSPISGPHVAAPDGAARGAPAPPALDPAAIPDELIDRIAERVAARMADDTMRHLVVETAERLVREEIERIKAMSGAAHAPSAG